MVAAPHVRKKTATEIRLCAVDYRGVLDIGESLTGTPVVTAIPAGLTISNESVNSIALEINNQSVPIGKAVQFKVAGGVSGVTYTITTTCDTDSTPAQEDVEGTLTLIVT